MWFSFPKGCTGITVEHQSFAVEITGDDGKAYFRAPDHFAPRILIVPGFVVESNPPEGAPDDLPRSDPLRDGAIAELTVAVEAQKREIQDMRSDLGSAAARITALMNEKAVLEQELATAKTELANWQEQLDDGTIVLAATNVEPLKKAK